MAPALLIKAHLIKAHIKTLTKTKAKTRKRKIAVTKIRLIAAAAAVIRNPNTNLIPRYGMVVDPGYRYGSNSALIRTMDKSLGSYI